MNLRPVFAFLTALIVASAALAQALPPLASGVQAFATPSSVNAALTFADLGRRDGASLQTLEFQEFDDGILVTGLTLEEHATKLYLQPFSIRSSDFHLVVCDGSGLLQEVPAPHSITVRGTDSDTQTVVVGSYSPDRGLTAVAFTPDSGFVIQPAIKFMLSQERNQHFVYQPSGIPRASGLPPFCGVEPAANFGIGREWVRARSELTCEIAVEVDYDFYLQNDASIQETTADVEALLVAVNEIYERDLGIHLELSALVIRTTTYPYDSPPYTAFELLSQFRAEWQANHTDIHRDLAHLLTGQVLQGDHGGYAFGRNVCSYESGFCVAQSFPLQGISPYRIYGTSHEVGHVLGASHCDSNPECDEGDCYIMHSSSYQGWYKFGQCAIDEITEFVSDRYCLDELPALSVPLHDSFEDETLDDSLWRLTDARHAEPSDEVQPVPGGAQSLKFEPMTAQTAYIRTHGIDLSDTPVEPFVAFFRARDGVPSGRVFRVQFRDINSYGYSFETAYEEISDGTQFVDFEYLRIPVPAAFRLNGFAVRIEATTSIFGSSGSWYIDEFSVGPNPGNDAPFSDDFEEGTLELGLVWLDASEASHSTLADNEPSGLQSLLIENEGYIESYPFFMERRQGEDWYLRCFTQWKEPGEGDVLVIELKNSSDQWVSYPVEASENAQTRFRLRQIPLSEGMFHNKFAVRFRVTTQGAETQWFIDDFAISPDYHCPGDFNGDGTVNSLDYFEFSNAYNEGDWAADITHDGNVNSLDWVAFLNYYTNECGE